MAISPHKHPRPPGLEQTPPRPPRRRRSKLPPLAARAAADAAYFSNNVAPYLVQDLGITSDALKRQIVTNLLILSSNLNSMQTAQHAAVSNLLRRQAIPMPQFWIDGKGNSCYFDHMNADGSPAIKVTQGIEAVETVGAQNLWPSSLWSGASTGFGLNGSTNGTNILLAQWDVGDVLTTHQEFTTNGNSRVSVYTHYYYGIDSHATFVAGIMIASGVDPNAIGFAPQARLVESYYTNDLTGMAQLAATNNVRESNHSYAIPGRLGWLLQLQWEAFRCGLATQASQQTSLGCLGFMTATCVKPMTKLSIQLNITSPCFPQGIQTATCSPRAGL